MIERLDVEQHISIKTHKPYGLKVLGENVMSKITCVVALRPM
jgi:hypothetical protein